MGDPWDSPAWVESVAGSAIGADLGDPSLSGVIEVVVAAKAAARRGGARAVGADAARMALQVRGGVVDAWGPPAAGEEPVVTFTLPAPDAREIVVGASPSVAFMRGRLKVDGDPGTALAVLSATARPGWAAALQQARGDAGNA